MLRGEETSSISRLIALKPRQVLIAEQKQKLEPRSTMAKKQLKEQPKEETDTPKAELNLALLHSVIKYVHDKGFAKTFKRFLKEARVEDDAWKADSFDLEDMYRGYLEKCRGGDTDFKGQKEQEQNAFNTMEKDADGDKDAPVETISKKKKKKKISEENDDNAKSAICELKTDESMRNQIDKKKKKNKLTSESNDENGTCKESLHDVTQRIPETFETMVSNDNKDSVDKTKSKDKSKKQKIETVSPLEDGKRAENVVSRDKNAADFPMDDSKTKLKEKKKKKKEALSEKLADNGVENKGKSEETFDNVANKESKKRKRSDSDENKDKPIEEATVEESKWRKSEGVKEAKVAVEVNMVLGGNGDVGGENKEENFTQKSTSVEHFDISTKGDLSDGVQKSSALRSAKKQRNGSTEPKTVNAFQRVKVDAVEFADERLQNNSYWAKDGAEIGYGAKAQEVLGQVKGRDFRHEKTKKKRGSYRGGLIDLQSHSVKFNYSDEE